MESIQIEATGLDHPEGVAVDQSGRLWAVGEAGQVYVTQPTSGEVEVLCVIDGAGLGIAFDREDNAYVCTRLNTIVKVTQSGDWHIWADEADGQPLATPNFPAFHPDGRLLVSGSGGYPERTGVVYAFDESGRGTVFHHGPFAYANGIAVDMSREWLYIVQTGADNVVRVPLAEPDGAVADVLEEGSLMPMPDGIAFDAEGVGYVTSYAGDAVEWFDPDGRTGVLAEDERAQFFNRPTNCAFGGEDNKVLYVANLGGTHLTAVLGETPGLPLPAPLEGKASE